MKRLLTLMLARMLLSALAVPCFASSYIPVYYTQSYDTYEEFLKGSAEPGEWYLPDDYFYPYENFTALGELSCVVQYKRSNSTEVTSRYKYRLRDANGIEFFLDCYNHQEPSFFVETHGQGHLGRIDNYPKGVYVRINGAYYVYNTRGELSSIMFGDPAEGRVSFSISASDQSTALCDYPIDQEQTLLARLLNAETAHDAVDELNACIENGPAFTAARFSAPAWVLPPFIGGGVVVLAAAATVTVIIIRRKKRKTVVVDAPTEEETA